MAEYWELDDYLCGSERISVSFLEEGKKMSFIRQQPGKGDDDIRKGDKADLPLYLALNLESINVIEINIPPFFTLEFNNKLVSEPLIVNLRKQTHFYFGMAFKLGLILMDESCKKVVDAYLRRSVELLKVAQFLSYGNTFLSKLTDMEH